MVGKSLRVGIAFAAALLVGGVSFATEEDPKLGQETYYGAGEVELAPEYAEVFLTFSASCQASAESLRKAIDSESGPVWKAIQSQVTGFSETDRKYWGDIQNIQAQPDSRLVRDNANPINAKRISSCDGKELALDAAVGQVFSGSQRIGVRSSDLDWLESLVRAFNARPQGNQRSDVKLSASSIRYDVTDATKREMRLNVQQQAREQATGPGSVFESDMRTLKFKSAHFLGHKRAYVPRGSVSTDQPIERGQAPKVSVGLPFVYTIYAESEDRIQGAGRSSQVGLVSEYQVTGTAVGDADFGVSDIQIASQCQASRTDAAKAIEAPSASIRAQLKQFHGGKAASETDRVIENNPGAPTVHFPYEPVEWAMTDAVRSVAIRYQDLCTGKIVDAPKAGNISDLPGYWASNQLFTVRSSEFDTLIQLVEDLQNKFGVSSTDRKAVQVNIANVRGEVTNATLHKLTVQARENATSCVLDPNGLLADDAMANKFGCAHLKSIRIESAGGGMRGGFALESAGPKSAAMVSEQPDEMEVVVVKRDGETRPTITLRGEYGFDFQFLTEDYVPSVVRTPLP